MLVVAYLAGIATPFALYAALSAVILAVGDGGGRECLVCDHLQVDINEHRSRLYIWVRVAWHRIWWRPRRWHREAVTAYRVRWQPRR